MRKSVGIFRKASLAAVIVAFGLSAQDIIYLNNGTQISADVLRGSGIDVEKLQSGELKYLSLGEIRSIKFSNGSAVNYKCDNCTNSNSLLVSGIFYTPKGSPVQTQSQTQTLQSAGGGSDDEEIGTVRPRVQITAELDGIIIEMDGKEYADRKKKLLDFVAKSQKMQEKLPSLRSAAPGCYEIASLAIEMLKYTMDMSEQVGAEMNGYRKSKSSGSLGAIVISNNKISFETSNTLINKAQTLLAAAPRLKGELSGPAALAGAPMLAFATAVIPITIKELTLMIKASKALRELQRAGS